MAKSVHVIPDKEVPRSMDYDQLRREGIQLNQELSGELWTDYNVHDPGVTILEQFSYVLTDIAYRTNLPIETLLFHGKEHEEVLRSNALFPAEEIFPSSPVSPNDYRILFLDQFPHYLSNCWVNHISDHREGIKGLYKITLLLKGSIDADQYDGIREEIRACFNAHRNLCEDLEMIEILNLEHVSFSCELDIFQDESVEDIISEILYQVEHYFNPTVEFSQLEDLEKMGKSFDEIFDLPSFKHGFILEEELRAKQTEFYISKISDIIFGVTGVRAIRNLQVFQAGVPVIGNTLYLDDNKFFSLGFLRSESEVDPFTGFNIKVNKGGIVNKFSKDVVLYSLEMKWARNERSYEIKTRPFKLEGNKVDTAELVSYESIQKSFPEIYGVGDFPPLQEEGEERIAQSWQLKAYLMLFDQLMVNHLSQLSNLSNLFDVEGFDPSEFRTYFSQLLSGNIPGAEELIVKTLPPLKILETDFRELKARKKRTSEEEALLVALQEDIRRKKRSSKSLAKKYRKKYGTYSKHQLSKLKFFQDRMIINKFEALLTEEDAKKVDKLEKSLLDSIEDELLTREHQVDFESGDMDRLMAKFDHSVERKNRLLSHMLARFGERFTTDFHLKFSSMLEGESEEHIERHLLRLKSMFISEVGRINRYRSLGLNYLNKDLKKAHDIPLKRKLGLLLNIEHKSHERLSGVKGIRKFKVKQLSGSAISKSESEGGIRNELDEDKQNGATFLINSSSYFRFLFQYGLNRANYEIAKAEKGFEVLFHPPNSNEYSKVLQAPNRNAAETSLDKLIQFLKDANEESEGFHLVEHIVLRPLDADETFYDLIGSDGSRLFRSLRANKIDAQVQEAHDALLLASYPNNYGILKTPDEQYVLVIKSAIGRELAKSVQSFEKESQANTFMEECMALYKGAENLDQHFQLDTHVTFHAELMDESGTVLLRSVEDAEIDEQELRMKRLKPFLIHRDNYQLEQEASSEYKVFLSDETGKRVLVSAPSFPNSDAAEEAITKFMAFFREIQGTDQYDSSLRFQRLNSRSAEDYNFKLSVVFPNWTSRFHNQEFLQIFKQTLYNCSPAHLSLQLVGMNFPEMKEFEEQYFEYLSSLTDAELDDRDKITELASKILDTLNKKAI